MVQDKAQSRIALSAVAVKVKGRKRHLLVDTTQGWALRAKVHAADVMDSGSINVQCGIYKLTPA